MSLYLPCRNGKTKAPKQDEDPHSPPNRSPSDHR